MASSKLQEKEDAYLETLNAALKKVPADGDWDWPSYGLTSVSGVVLGWRRYTDEEGVVRMEAVYSVTVRTQYAVPHAGQGQQDVNDDGSQFTFVQAANSVAVRGGYETQLLSTCLWAPPPKKRAAKERALAVALDDPDDPPNKPHPP
jgi:hypothetical protein